MGCGTVRGSQGKSGKDKSDLSPIKERAVYKQKQLKVDQFEQYFQQKLGEQLKKIVSQDFAKPERLKQNLDESSQLMILDLIKIGNVKQVQDFYLQNSEISLLEEIGSENSYWTVLHYCVYFGYEELLGHLISHLYIEDRENFQENINYQTREGLSLIMIACILNYELCVKQLLLHGGIDSELLDKNCQSAYDHAYYFNSYEALCCFQLNAIQGAEINLEMIRKNDKKLEKQDYSEYTQEFQRNLEIKEIIDNGDISEEQGAMGTIRYRGEKSREILKECIKTNKKFIDNDFRHEIETIVVQPEQFKNIVWLRPHQIKKLREKDMHLFHKIDSIDVKHGIEIVSQITAVISAIAEQPPLLMVTFNNIGINLYNIYSVQFYVDGRPIEVFVDDYVPCIQYLNTPLFMQVNSNEIYPYILEKAYAKINNNYFKGVTQNPELALEEMLGAPVKSYLICQQDENKIQKIISRAIEQKRVCILVASDECDIKMGIRPGFSYPVVDFFKIKDRYVYKVRSVYGRFDLKSEYNQDFQDWLQANHGDKIKDADLGYFYMCGEDIMQYFYYLSVSHYQINYVYNNMDIECTYKKASYISFKVEEKMKVCIRIHQPKGQPIQRMDVKLIREENNGNVTLQSENFQDGWDGKRTLNVSGDTVFLNLLPSVYYLRIKIYGEPLAATQQSSKNDKDSAQSMTSKFVVSSYSEKFNKLKIEEKVQGQFVYKQFLKNKIFTMQHNDDWNQIALISSAYDNRWLELIGIENQGENKIQATISMIEDNNNVYFRNNQKKQKIVVEINPKKKFFTAIKYKEIHKQKPSKWAIEFVEKDKETTKKPNQ